MYFITETWSVGAEQPRHKGESSHFCFSQLYMISSFYSLSRSFAFSSNKGNNVCNSNTRRIKMNGISCRFQRRTARGCPYSPAQRFLFQQFKICCDALFNIFLVATFRPLLNRSNQKIFNSACGTTVPISRPSITMPPTAISCCRATSFHGLAQALQPWNIVGHLVIAELGG